MLKSLRKAGLNDGTVGPISLSANGNLRTMQVVG